jgi:hypothetical protein
VGCTPWIGIGEGPLDHPQMRQRLTELHLKLGIGMSGQHLLIGQ